MSSLGLLFGFYLLLGFANFADSRQVFFCHIEGLFWGSSHIFESLIEAFSKFISLLGHFDLALLHLLLPQIQQTQLFLANLELVYWVLVKNVQEAFQLLFIFHLLVLDFINFGLWQIDHICVHHVYEDLPIGVDWSHWDGQESALRHVILQPEVVTTQVHVVAVERVIWG